MSKLIRVFPRRTSFLPQDDLVFVGDPPLWRPQADRVHISVAFTWDMMEGKRLAAAWGQFYPVSIGGPALNSPCDEFTPGLYTKHGVTFTSRGCDHSCPWCLVPGREGKLHLLNIAPGHIIQDNNFLQTGRDHMERVFEMLKVQRRPATFSGGLEADLIDDWVVDKLKGLRIEQVFLSCDTDGALRTVTKAAQKLAFLGRNKLRCYVLLGFSGESLAKGEARLERIWELGFLPFAQLYQPSEHWIEYSSEWRRLARRWSRPAATKALHYGTRGV